MDELKLHERRALMYFLNLIATHGPMSVRQAILLREKDTGFRSGTTVQLAVRHARKHKLVHIAGWKRSYGTKGAMAPLYGTGSQDDVPKPASDRTADNRRYYDVNGRAYRGAKKRVYSNPWLALAWPERVIPYHLSEVLSRQDGRDECGHLPPAVADDWASAPSEAELQVLAPYGRSAQRRSSP